MDASPDAPVEAAVDAQQIADAKWFEQLVMANVYRPARDAAVWAELVSPEHVDRTRGVLVLANSRAVAVLARLKAGRAEFRAECLARGEAGKGAWLGSREEFEARRRKTVHFARDVQRALSEVTAVRRELNRAADGQRGCPAAGLAA